jgi:hypothetical protein
MRYDVVRDCPNIETTGHTKLVNTVNPQLFAVMEMKVGLEKLLSQLFEVCFLAYSIAYRYEVGRQITERRQCCNTKQQIYSTILK